MEIRIGHIVFIFIFINEKPMNNEMLKIHFLISKCSTIDELVRLVDLHVFSKNEINYGA